jgi:hypothetical protein
MWRSKTTHLAARHEKEQKRRELGFHYPLHVHTLNAWKTFH